MLVHQTVQNLVHECSDCQRLSRCAVTVNDLHRLFRHPKRIGRLNCTCDIRDDTLKMPRWESHEWAVPADVQRRNRGLSVLPTVHNFQHNSFAIPG